MTPKQAAPGLFRYRYNGLDAEIRYVPSHWEWRVRRDGVAIGRGRAWAFERARDEAGRFIEAAKAVGRRTA